MAECPVCQSPMEENLAYVTECCHAELAEATDPCPGCGAENPIVVAGEPVLVCEQCGFAETKRAADPYGRMYEHTDRNPGSRRK